MSHVIVSKANKSLLVPATPGVKTMFPSALLLPHGNGVERAIVPHELRETLMLRHLGFKVPNPIDYHYDWAGAAAMGKPPYAVQRATCRMMVEYPRSYVLNDMGTGKTKTALWAWDYLNKNNFAKKMLVVAPKSTLNFVWGREVFSTLPGRKVRVLHGSKAYRLEQLGLDADIYVINHDGVKTIESELLARADIDVLCIDELAVYRNNSERSKKMRKFAKKFAIVWGMTGSPMPNEPTDAWAQCMIVSPSRVPPYRSHARDMLMSKSPFSQFTWIPKPDATAVAHTWMQPSCRYSLGDVVELPQVISRVVDVPLSDEQDKTYKTVARAMSAMVKDKKITAVNAGVAMGKLLQIAGGWIYTQNPEFVRVDPTPRILALADLIQSASKKVLVAIPFRHMMNGISKILSMKGIDIEHCIVNGSVNNRDEFFNAFQNTSKYKAMLVDPRCVRHGLTLTAADTLIWYLPVTSLEVYDQFNARITRIGQTEKQQVIHLQATPIERHIYKLLREHKKMQDLFLKLVEEATDDAT